MSTNWILHQLFPRLIELEQKVLMLMRRTEIWESSQVRTFTPFFFVWDRNGHLESKKAESIGFAKLETDFSENIFAIWPQNCNLYPKKGSNWHFQAKWSWRVIMFIARSSHYPFFQQYDYCHTAFELKLDFFWHIEIANFAVSTTPSWKSDWQHCSSQPAVL